MVTAFVVLWFLNRSTAVVLNYGTRRAVAILGLGGVPFAGVGALVVARARGNAVGWICLAAGLLLTGSSLAGEYAAYALLTAPGSLPNGDAAAWLSNWTWLPAFTLIGVYLVLLFPDGRLLSRRWRPVAWLAGAGTGAAITFFAFFPGRLVSVPYATNPFGLESAAAILEALSLGFFFVPLCMLAAGTSLILRFRRSRGEERQQLKWFASAGALAGSAYFLQTAYSLATGTIENPTAGGRVVQDVTVLTFYALPAAAGIAILKYRLYDIDVIINRTLVYGALSAALAVVYGKGVVTIGGALRSVTGGEGGNLAVAGSTLVVAALFRPLRDRIQGFIDRRFYRSKYDAATMLERFSTSLRDEVDLDSLTGELHAVVRQTMSPAHASVWLQTRPIRMGPDELAVTRSSEAVPP